MLKFSQLNYYALKVQALLDLTMKRFLKAMRLCSKLGEIIMPCNAEKLLCKEIQAQHA